MKQKHMFSLLDQTYTTVRVQFPSYNPDDRYEEGHKAPKLKGAPWQDTPSAQGYIYKVPLAWDLQVDDELIVDTSAGLIMTTVVRVDDVPEIDVDANFDYKWAVQKVDRTEYNALVDKEKRFSSSLQEIERVKHRDAIVASFRESLPEGTEARRLFEQTTATLAAPPAPPVPEAPAPDAPGSDGTAAPWEAST